MYTFRLRISLFLVCDGCVRWLVVEVVGSLWGVSRVPFRDTFNGGGRLTHHLLALMRGLSDRRCVVPTNHL